MESSDEQRTNDGTRVFIKGAPEAVLRLCGAPGDPAVLAARAAAEAMAARARTSASGTGKPGLPITLISFT